MRRRDETEFTEFVAAAALQLRRTAFLMCGDWHKAEDATQDALIKVYGAWNRLDRQGGLRAYATRAVVTAVIDESRRSWRRERSTEVVPNGAPTHDQVETVDTRLLVFAALASLPPRQRACVVLRHYGDLSLEETARVLGISTGAVKSLTSRGLGRLRERIGIPGETYERTAP